MPDTPTPTTPPHAREPHSPARALTVGMGIVSWRSHTTLRKTLQSFRDGRLFENFDAVTIHFQDVCDEDRAIADEFGLPHTGGENVGIAEGMRINARELGTDLVLFMENDCPLVVDAETTRQYLAHVVDLFDQDKIDIMRLRNRWLIGRTALEKYNRFHPVRDLHPDFRVESQPVPQHCFRDTWKRRIGRLLRPFRAASVRGRAVYIERRPADVFPSVIRSLGPESYAVDSSGLNWTNQSVMCRGSLFLDELMPYVDAHPSSRTSNGFQSPERPLNCAWWRARHYRIGVEEGLFCHERIDGSWRPNHAAYEPEEATP